MAEQKKEQQCYDKDICKIRSSADGVLGQDNVVSNRNELFRLFDRISATYTGCFRYAVGK